MSRRMKKLLAAGLTAAALAVALWLGLGMVQEHYVIWNGTLLPKESQSLDIRGRRMRRVEAFLEFPHLQQLDARDTQMTVEQYRWLREELPDCHVLWDVPVQGSYYSQDTQTLAVEQLTDADIDALQYLPRLSKIDAPGWEDLDGVQILKSTYSGCTLRHGIRIGADRWDSDAVSLVVDNAEAEELLQKLPFFSRLESVLLTGEIPSLTELKELQQQFPEVFFLWKLEAFGRTLETDLEYLDLSGAGLKQARELEDLLPYFPRLKTVRLDDCGLTEADCIAVARQFSDIQFIFGITVGDHVLRTDAVEIDISNTPLESTAQIEDLLPCFRDLERVVMCRCGIPSEEMDALNKRHEDIRFVWSVDLAGMEFRTDAVHFTPNRWGLKVTDENIYDLRYCTDMVCVDVGHGIRLTNCDWAAFMPELKYLILAETGISDLTPLTGHKNLIYLELFLSKVTDYSPLTTCKALEDLNLCYTRGSYKPIAEMTWLKRLWWSGSWKARITLPDLMPDSVYMEFLSTSSTGRGWREGQNYYDMRDFIGMDYMVG